MRNQRQCACSVAMPHLQRCSQVCHRNRHHDGCRCVASNCYDFPVTPFLFLSSAKQAAHYQQPHLFRSQQQHPHSLQSPGSRLQEERPGITALQPAQLLPGPRWLPPIRPHSLASAQRLPPHRHSSNTAVCRTLGRACRQTLTPHGSGAMSWVPSRRSWCPGAFPELPACRARAQPAPRLRASPVPSITAGLLAASQMHFSLSD